MTTNEALRFIAGIMILISLLLSHFHSDNWLWFTAFIGVNLLQSSVSNWCFMMTILRKIGLKKDKVSCSN